MKILLAALGLVVLVGCQDLGDYPDYTTPKTTTGTTGDGSIDGLPVYSGIIDWNFNIGNRQDGISIPTEDNVTNVTTEGNLPNGLTVFFHRVYLNPKKPYSACWLGTPTVSGRFEFFLIITNPRGQTRVKMSVTIHNKPQSVAQ